MRIVGQHVLEHIIRLKLLRKQNPSKSELENKISSKCIEEKGPPGDEEKPQKKTHYLSISPRFDFQTPVQLEIGKPPKKP